MSARIGRRAALALPLAAAGLSRPAIAQSGFPSRPVRMLVPWAPGGTTDVQMRALCDAASRRLGQPVVVENKSGAGGILGAQALLNERPDGYALSQMPISAARSGSSPCMWSGCWTSGRSGANASAGGSASPKRPWPWTKAGSSPCCCNWPCRTRAPVPTRPAKPATPLHRTGMLSKAIARAVRTQSPAAAPKAMAPTIRSWKKSGPKSFGSA